MEAKSRFGRSEREAKPDAATAAPGGSAAVPLDVHVPAAGPGAGRAWIGGVPVVAGEGEEIQRAVLARLHRIALAAGRSVYVTIHDERVDCVVPLRVDLDGSSHLTAEPVAAPPGAGAEGVRAANGAESVRAADVPPAQPPAPAPASVPDPAPAPTPGPASLPAAVPALGGEPEADARFPSAPGVGAGAGAASGLASVVGTMGTDVEPAAGAAPPRGFDAVAEAVLAEEPAVGAGAPPGLAAAVAQINEAVRSGRIPEAARLAEHTVAGTTGILGPEHAEVLRLRALTAYIAYLAGDPVRAFHLCLDLARVHQRTRDAEAAYGNVQSAATAWRAVRDPSQGLDLGRDLIGLWEELSAVAGPAADDVEQLGFARARMTRLAARAAAGRQ
ncbi:tetratricopeptide repeat protein [Streptomyces sp. MUM 136J]|uniref:tetratricopeptide repeat protein n=1 Tax=Streptomyces sp. MUM 136J TaxID=2791992 RepID=UPI001F0461B4|nr:tetratricopeptide repeat protein [Streptomyces sp. MUM 136J]MCH0568646.1 tetratricopeptide repeat protein [Streptomyces sp. MUM 136J]